MSNFEQVYSVHPNWIALLEDSNGVETGAVKIIDVYNDAAFNKLWHKASTTVRAEFGFNSPLFARGDHGAHVIELTFAEYVYLVEKEVHNG